MTTAEQPPPLTLAEEIAAINSSRDARRFELVNRHCSPETITHILVHEFSPLIARLAMRNGITPDLELLLQSIESIAPERPQQQPPLSIWAERQSQLGGTDARSRAAGDHRE